MPFASSVRTFWTITLLSASMLMITMGMRDEVHRRLPPGVDMKPLIGSDQPVGLQPDKIRHDRLP